MFRYTKTQSLLRSFSIPKWSYSKLYCDIIINRNLAIKSYLKDSNYLTNINNSLSRN